MVAKTKSGGRHQRNGEVSEPSLETRDRDEPGVEDVEPDDMPGDEPLIADLELLEESERDIFDDDDNPYQESDEALPDDAEEAAIRRDLAR